MRISEVLKKSKALIEDPSHWTAGRYASNDDEDECSVLDPRACAFCSVGAVLATLGVTVYDLAGSYGPPDDVLVDTYDRALTYLGRVQKRDMSVHHYNDEFIKNHEQLMEWWNDAINLAAREGN